MSRGKKFDEHESAPVFRRVFVRSFLRDVNLYLQPASLLSISRDFQIYIKYLFESLAFQGSRGQIICNNAAVINDYNAVCKAGGQVEIMENDEGAQLRRQKLPHRRERVDLVPDVKVRNGFIEEEELLFLRRNALELAHDPGKVNALLFAPRELLVVTLLETSQIKMFSISLTSISLLLGLKTLQRARARSLHEQ